MNRVEWLARAALAFCLLYGAVALYDQGSEKFPIFAWDLFVRVPPAQAQDYAVRLLEIDGTAAEPPVYFEDARALLKLGGSVSAQAQIQKVGAAITRRSPDLATERAVFETRYLQDAPNTRYQVVRRRFDLIQRIHCHCFVDETVIAEFTVT